VLHVSRGSAHIAPFRHAPEGPRVFRGKPNHCLLAPPSPGKAWRAQSDPADRHWAQPRRAFGDELVQALDTLRDPRLVEQRDAHMERLRRLFHGQVEGRAYFLCGRRGVGRSDAHKEPEAWLAEALEDVAQHGVLLADQDVFRPLVIEYGPYGVHLIDRIFGATVYELGTPGNWQAECLSEPVGSLEAPCLADDETWALAKRVALRFVETGATVPLFGLPTLSSAINAFLNLYGGAGLVAMLAEPEAASRDLHVINDLIIELHTWYREHIPAAQLQPVVADARTQPPGFGQLCGCSTQLLSRATYAHLIAPLDAELLSVHPNGGMIHLCGTHAQHVPTWREMTCLKAVQVNDRAAEDLEAYFHGLREDQILYVNPCPGMPVERILEITGGRRTVIVGDRPA